MRIRRAGKLALWPLDRVLAAAPLPYLILTYHSVGADADLELDLTITQFREQLQRLSRDYEVVPLDALVERLANGVASPSARPLVAITFDDAYRSFAEVALPILAEYGFPVTLYVPTESLDTGAEFPWTAGVRAGRPELLRPMSWDQLGAALASGLVSIGNHTHRHRVVHTLPEADVRAEIMTCNEMLRQRVGASPTSFCFPAGRSSETAVSVVREFFRYAVIGRVGRAPLNDLWRLRRIAPLRSDPAGLLWRALTGKDRAYIQMRGLLGRA
jgi:peptidoglycan/xylan/chitin deacetylase (PgdA/CDA1 family)